MTPEDSQNRRINRLLVMFLFIGAIPLMLHAIYIPLEREQEARVLEVAREMLGAPLEQWIVPRINGEVRVQKPPLTYWISAASMKIFGISTGAGRAPFVLVMTLTAAAIFQWGRREFSVRAGVFAALMTIGSVLYSNYGILAETDAISVLFVMLGIASINRCADSAALRDRAKWSALAGVFAGLAAMSKGPPALFVPVYAAVLSIWERNGRVFRDFALLGGFLAMMLIGAPWWLMMAKNPQHSLVLSEELSKMQTGSNHGRPFWHAFLLAGSAVLPFIAPIIAMAFGMPWTRPIQRCFIWFALAMITLTLTPQKQGHYFFQIIPPIMLMASRFIDIALNDETGTSRIHRLVIGSLVVTAIVGAAGSPAFLFLGKSASGRQFAIFLLPTLFFLMWGGFAVQMIRGKKPIGNVVYAFVGFAVFTSAFSLQALKWSNRTSFAEIASEMKRMNLDRQAIFFPQANYRLNFELRKIIPVAETPEALRDVLNDNPDLVVIVEKPTRQFELPDFISPELIYRDRGNGMIIGTYAK